MENYIGKNIRVATFMDTTYRVGGTPQINCKVWVNGRLETEQKYDGYNKLISTMNRYGKKTGQYTRRANQAYGVWEYEMNFVYEG